MASQFQGKDWESAFLAQFQALFSKQAVPSGTKSPFLSLGLEHEFFLEQSPHTPADHKTGQRFFTCLIGAGWEPLFEEDPAIGRFITAVFMHSRLGTVRIKYEHHPHLLEMVTPPCEGVDDLICALSIAWAASEDAANSAGCFTNHSAFAPTTADDSSIWSDHNLCRRLREYRQFSAKQHGGSLSRRLLNFSAEIAATQLHFGGIPWEEFGDFIAGLYRFEPWLLSCAAAEAATKDVSAREIVARRWNLYRDALQGYPLVGFPDLEEWSIKSWARAIGQMPMLPTRPDISSSLEIKGKLVGPDADWPAILAGIRDLQILRPRIFGTVECRADPALPSLAAIRRQVERRIAAATKQSGAIQSEGTFEEVRRLWWSLGERDVEQGLSK
jgi:hypothetical protein